MKHVLAAVLTLSCWAVAPAALSAVTPVAADYAPGSQTLQLSLPAGVVPNARELAHPPRFVIDLPGAPPARTIERDYPSGIASHLSVRRLGSGTRVVVGLRRPLSNAWRANLLGDRLQFALAPAALAQAPLRPPVPHASSSLVPHPLPRLKPSSRPLPPRATQAPAASSAHATLTPTRPLTPPGPAAPHLPGPAAPNLPGPAAPHLPAPALTSPTLPPIQAPSQLPSPGAAETPAPVATPTPAPAARPTPAPRPEPSPLATPPHPAAVLPPAPTPAPVASAAPAASAAPGVAAAPAATNACRIGTVAYDERIRILSVPLAGPVSPQYTLTEAPARLTIDLPGSTIGAAQHLANPAGLATAIAAYQSSPTAARVVVDLARPIGSNYLVKQTPGALIVIFDRKPVTP